VTRRREGVARPTGGRRWALAVLVLGGLALGTRAVAAGDAYAALDRFARVLVRVESTALRPPGRDALVDAALRGLVSTLDPHSAYYDAESWGRVQAEVDGVYVGIGAGTTQAACGERIEDLVPGGPAEGAGLRVGECIGAVDGRSLAGLSAEDATALLHGQEGSVATLTVLAPGGGTRAVAVLRARVVQPCVRRVGEGVPVVLRVRQVGDRAPAELDQALAAAGDEVRGGVVLDLRGNPGGRLERAVAIVDRFVSAGPIVRTEGRDAAASRAWSATADPGDVVAPLVVLVDGGTASAAEIIAGALQDAGRARLVGTPTYGKGTVQGFYGLEDGSMLKLTEAVYRLPKGELVLPHVGLTPDVQLSLPSPDPAAAAREHVRSLVTLSEAERVRLLQDIDALAGPERAVPPDAGPDQALQAAIDEVRALARSAP